MLEEISINDLGIISKANLNFTKGFNVITGETGAGKTMVLSALHLLLGKRSDSGMIRTGASKLSVEGCWDTSLVKNLAEIEETGAVIEDDQLFINRSVNPDGKSRAVIGGKTTPASVLASISGSLVNIHGQSDQIRLKNTVAQRDALDAFAGVKVTEKLAEYKKAYKEYKRLLSFLDEVQSNSAARKREIAGIRKFIEDFEKLDPQPNEDVELEKEIDALSNIDSIRESVAESLVGLSDDYESPGAMTLLENTMSALGKVAAYDEELASLRDRGDEILDLLADFQKDLENYAESLDEESLYRLHEAQERLIELKGFIRRNGSSLDDVLEQREVVQDRLDELEQYEQPIEDIEEDVTQALAKVQKLADEITVLRTEAKKNLEEQVNKELSGLAMSSTLIVSMEKVDLSPSGQDNIELMLLQPGSDAPRPIAKSASGGELSRIMLALEVVLADPESTPTFVFDEVDSGVGGTTAIEIGKRLAKLSKEAQVIVVTHLPQVAAYADNHLVVTKSTSDVYTETNVKTLNSEERVDEITRMLSGMTGSETGKAHAIELIEHAQDFKNS